MQQNAQYQYPPPQGQYGGPPQQQPAVIITQPVVTIGGCPHCRVGVMTDEFTCCGIFLAIFFFPIGVLCCWVMRTKRCTNCGASFD